MPQGVDAKCFNNPLVFRLSSSGLADQPICTSRLHMASITDQWRNSTKEHSLATRRAEIPVPRFDPPVAYIDTHQRGQREGFCRRACCQSRISLRLVAV